MNRTIRVGLVPPHGALVIWPETETIYRILGRVQNEDVVPKKKKKTSVEDSYHELLRDREREKSNVPNETEVVENE